MADCLTANPPYSFELERLDNFQRLIPSYFTLSTGETAMIDTTKLTGAGYSARTTFCRNGAYIVETFRMGLQIPSCSGTTLIQFGKKPCNNQLHSLRLWRFACRRNRLTCYVLRVFIFGIKVIQFLHGIFKLDTGF
jgi:hypothetical protein